MTKSGLLGAAAIVLATTLAAPAMAQQVIDNPGYCAQFYPNANCLNNGPGNPYTGDYQRRAGYRHTAYRDRDWNGRDNWNSDAGNTGWHDGWNDNRWDRHDTGFWPGDVAADVVGGAIGTAGAIATAPFRGDSYASYNNGYYNNGWNGWDNRSYAERNGFVCQPGAWVRAENGRMQICQ